MAPSPPPARPAEELDQDEAIRLFSSLCRILDLPRRDRNPGRVVLELLRLRELRAYATHRPGCAELDALRRPWERRCTCGYAAKARPLEGAWNHR